ncbi:hypothetical protein GTO10_03250 [Candidatus Saccharibacteria bacterium]|nr:hypothetical protein [candidate division Zixibacteria bacterium]NIT03924.1 hypothetical protein [Candidatus Saccharibacteria bacterium]
MITAEAIPKPEKARHAAAALQKVGFRVISIGYSITIGGEPKLFERTFSTRLGKVSKDAFPSVPGAAQTEYYRPQYPPVIPERLRNLVDEIHFPEPPEFF